MIKITYKNRVYNFETDDEIMCLRLDSIDSDSRRALMEGAREIHEETLSTLRTRQTAMYTEINDLKNAAIESLMDGRTYTAARETQKIVQIEQGIDKLSYEIARLS